MAGKKWNQEDIDYLKFAYENQSYEQIAKKLDRTVESVKHKAYDLGINDKVITERKSWTEDEIKYINLMYGKQSVEKTAKKLKRSVSSVKHKARDLGVSAYKDEKVSFSVISKCFGVDKSVITNWYNKYGMPATLVKRGAVNYYSVDVDKFWKWLENHKRLVKWNKYERGSLLPEPDYLKETIRAFEVVNSRKPWTILQKRRVQHDYNVRGKSLEDIAKEYGRSVESIKHVIRERL